MNKYREQIEQIETEVYYNMGKYSQRLIDFIEHITERIDTEKVYDDMLGAFQYSIDTYLEIWNPEFRNDIETLHKIDTVLINWQKEIES